VDDTVQVFFGVNAQFARLDREFVLQRFELANAEIVAAGFPVERR